MAHACPYKKAKGGQEDKKAKGGQEDKKAKGGQEAHGRTRMSNVTTEETHHLMGTISDLPTLQTY